MEDNVAIGEQTLRQDDEVQEEGLEDGYGRQQYRPLTCFMM